MPVTFTRALGGTELQRAIGYGLALIAIPVMSFNLTRIFLRLRLREILASNTE
jgi:hypothetical protein